MSAAARHDGPGVSERDRRFLYACLDLARLGEGQTSPNPMVGALVVKQDRVLGQGYHRRAGDCHAEVEALEEAGAEARGARLYVNLEPCVHHGRTPPCVDAIIQAGVTEVVACMIDPDPRVNGQGFQRLSRAGIRVSRVKFVTTGRPFVTLKAGMTLDGKIAAASGESRWITSKAAREEVHRLRYGHDAVLVGVRTILADDPLLSARWGPGKPLVRAILDSHLRTPPTARALSCADGGKALIYTLPGSSPQARMSLECRSGVEVVEGVACDGRVDLHGVLTDLGKRRILSVLVEGGGQVLGGALAAGVADRLTLFIAPRLLGGAGIPAFSGPGAPALADAVSVLEWSWRGIGPDLLVEGSLQGTLPEEVGECSRG
ncbi:MAG: bifunctional diaminohydroxyphosphoribosylaminopyrimidine deaminase/5-amino-6-(5-phosphoribosylamino)uracil reductase RibD [Acidobacteria bacterium]|nr:MAG: bifunctional diaminohydroxyphosphoribosylaminopyrimidine deaminase/5-amino-6-(5-phosphoribosylamino)uracil reductase RibD [Acidobacteriota bacterium]